MILSDQDIMTFFGLSSMDNLATMVQNLAEQHVKDFLGWNEIEQQTWTEYYPLHEGIEYVEEPRYVVDSAHLQAVPGAFYQTMAIQLANIPVRSITSFKEDPSGYFGQPAGSFSAPALTSGTDYYLKTERDGIGWTGHVVRRSFWFPSTPGSMKIEYVAGFTEAELATGRYSLFKTAVLETAVDLYLRGKAVSLGHMPNIASETDGGGVAATYYRNRLGSTPVPDNVADMLQPYVFYGEGAL